MRSDQGQPIFGAETLNLVILNWYWFFTDKSYVYWTVKNLVNEAGLLLRSDLKGFMR